ncbi:MAG: exopolyphosphatase, partial [Pseudomonadota bacterium]|nr:exopolyphosphatase [Pseudomonadota bacterium]
GGHMNAGTCQVETSKAETVLGELIETITSDG